MAYFHEDDDAFDPKLVAEAQERERQENLTRSVREEMARPRDPVPARTPNRLMERSDRAVSILHALSLIDRPMTREEIAKSVWPWTTDILRTVPDDVVDDLIAWGWVTRDGCDLLAITPLGGVMVALKGR